MNRQFLFQCHQALRIGLVCVCVCVLNKISLPTCQNGAPVTSSGPKSNPLVNLAIEHAAYNAIVRARQYINEFNSS